jgi:hypothetical protein
MKLPGKCLCEVFSHGKFPGEGGYVVRDVVRDVVRHRAAARVFGKHVERCLLLKCAVSAFISGFTKTHAVIQVGHSFTNQVLILFHTRANNTMQMTMDDVAT